MAKLSEEQKEIRRLNGIYKGPDFAHRLAEAVEKGEVELFSQGDQEPYERERPASRIYTAANKSYQTIIKQLNDMIPKETDIADGGFDVS